MTQPEAAGLLQLALASAFVAMGACAWRYGADAQRAAEGEVLRQGYDAELLARHGVNFRERAAELVLPLSIAALLVLLAVLNLRESGIGRSLSLVVAPILLVAGGAVTASQVFAVHSIESAFRKADDANLRAVNVRRFVDAAIDVFPPGFRSLVIARFVLTTLGSATVVVLLTLT